MLKYRLLFDKDKEEKWLNEMSEQGYAMTGFCAGFYTFEESEPGKYIYQVDFGDHFFSISQDYREFMADAGVEIVQHWGYWIILRKLAKDGEFQLYTDVDSSLEHYQKIRTMFKAVTIFELLLAIFEFICYGLTETMSALIGGFLIFALAVVLMRAVVKTNDMINQLMERKTGIPAESGKRAPSPLLAVGLLFNSIGLMMNESVSDVIVRCVQIFAIVLMLVGIYETCRKKHMQEDEL